MKTVSDELAEKLKIFCHNFISGYDLWSQGGMLTNQKYLEIINALLKKGKEIEKYEKELSYFEKQSLQQCMNSIRTIQKELEAIINA